MRELGRDRIPWRDNGIWLVGDTHMHYRNVSVVRLAAEASKFCDFIVVTSHSHRPDVFRAQHGQIIAARKQFPNLMIFHGLEWGCPVGNHATLIVDKCASENAILSRFWRTYDRWYSPGKPKRIEDAMAGIRFLAEQRRKGETLVILNHPSSGRAYTLDHFRAFSDCGETCIGFEGAPGNQSRQPGSEVDPLVKNVGGAFDVLLSEGRRWSIVASSDFHSHVSDGGKNFRPGEFAKTYVYCPERSYKGILAGLKAGAIYLVHNDIAGELRFAAAGKTGDAIMGETLQAAKGDTVQFTLDCVERAPIARVEFISNDLDLEGFKVRKRAKRIKVGPWSRFRFVAARATHNFFVRARGVSKNQRKPYRNEPGDMWFYTNAIRVEVS